MELTFSKNNTELKDKVDKLVLDFNMSGNLTRWERNYEMNCLKDKEEDVERIGVKQLGGLWLICGIFLAVGVLAASIENCRVKNCGEDDKETNQDKKVNGRALYCQDKSCGEVDEETNLDKKDKGNALYCNDQICGEVDKGTNLDKSNALYWLHAFPRYGLQHLRESKGTSRY
jgi:hypothetical protein